MQKVSIIILLFYLISLFAGCSSVSLAPQVVATTKPVYDFTVLLCQNTDVSVGLLITENISCLHDYSLQVRQMRTIEAAEIVIISGAGLEDTMADALHSANQIIDASIGIELHCADDTHRHSHEGHSHESDPHIWLDISKARQMVENICNGLIEKYPQHRETFLENLFSVSARFDELEAYGTEIFSSLTCRNLITFHDGFSYFAEYWDLTILKSIEEESGSEASAGELKDIIKLVQQYDIPAIFTEENGSASAAGIIARETGVQVFSLNMGMSQMGYFECMYHNIDTIKEAFE